jgi:polyisoprenoid-binding protein YceI
MRYALTLGIIASMISASAVFAANPCNPCNPCAANMTKFTINDERNVLTFESKAPLEKIVGTTSKVMGHIHVNPKDITKGLMAKFELDLASLNTGIAKRDEHMRSEEFLHTEKYPKALLTLDKITKASAKELADKTPITVNAEGTLELHGVKRKVELEGIQVAYFKESEETRAKMPGDLLHIDGGFVVKLPDYNIKVPKLIVLKVDENIKINVDLFGTTAAMMSENPCNPCNPCGAKNACNPCAKKANPCNPCSQKKSK